MVPLQVLVLFWCDSEDSEANGKKIVGKCKDLNTHDQTEGDL